MPHVLVAGKIHEAGLAVLREASGFTADLVEEISTSSYAPLIGKADALLIRTQPLPAPVIADAPRLRVVSRHGVGYDAVDVGALNARRIPLAVVGDVNSGPVAEHALMLMLAIAKKTLAYDRAVREGGWNERNGFGATELEGKTLLVVGFGRIGRKVAQLARAFGMRVLAHDPPVPQALMREVGVEPAAGLLPTLAEADFVSVHVPGSAGGPVIGDAELRRMKSSAILVNTARGGVVDEEALAATLEEGRIAAAGLDVFADEPPSAGNRLLASARTVLSPHSAGLTEECARRMAVAAMRNILDFFEGRLDPALVVNREAIGFPGR
jgi:D-3-phosphoglycerate dehydrogenase